MLHWLVERSRRALHRVSRSPEWVLLLAATAVLVGFLFWVQVQAYDSFHTFAQDLGAYNQALYTTVYDHRFLYYTTQLTSGSNGDLFSIHFAPLLLVLVPTYLVAPGPLTLLLLKQIVVEAGVIPLFLLARLRLRSRAFAGLLSAGYLVAGPVMALCWTTFDPEVFLPVTILSAFYFLARHHWVGFLVSWIAALCAIETAAPLLAVFAAVALVGGYLGGILGARSASALSAAKEDRPFLVAGLVAAIGSFGVTALVLDVVYKSGGGYGQDYARHFQTLGATSIVSVPLRVLTHPGSAWAALNVDWLAKVEYIAIALGCVGFLPLFGRLRYLAPVAVWFALLSLSDVPDWFQYGSQYSGYFIPFLFAGAISGAPRLARLLGRLATSARKAGGTARTLRARRGALGVIAIFACGLVVTTAVASPLLPNPVAWDTSNASGITAVDAHDRLAARVVDMIPPRASVFTTAYLFPQVSNRWNAYYLPTGEVLFAPGRTFASVVSAYVNASDYILVDFVIDPVNANILLYFANATGGLSAFGVVAAADGTYLYERGWSGPPELWVPFNVTVQAGQLTPLGGSVLSGLGTPGFSGSIYKGPPGSKGKNLWRGPFPEVKLALPPGTYNATFVYQVNTTFAGTQVNFSLEQIPFSYVLTPIAVTSAGMHYQISLQVDFAGNTTLPPVPGSISKSMLGTIQSETTSISWALPVDTFLTTFGAEEAKNIYFWLYGIVLTQVGPPTPGT